MVALLVVLFIAVPIAELAVILQVGERLGVLPTLVLLIVVSVVGGWMVKREGLGVWRRARAQADAGHLPHRELVDGVLILFAGALLLTPGFLTDCLGILLLLPPVRAGLRGLALRRMQRRVVLRRRAAGVYDVSDARDAREVRGEIR